MAKKYFYMVVEHNFYNNELQFDTLNACSRFDSNKIYGSVSKALDVVSEIIADYKTKNPQADLKFYVGDNDTNYTHMVSQMNYNSDKSRIVILVKKMTLM